MFTLVTITISTFCITVRRIPATIIVSVVMFFLGLGSALDIDILVNQVCSEMYVHVHLMMFYVDKHNNCDISIHTGIVQTIFTILTLSAYTAVTIVYTLVSVITVG